MVSCVCIAIDSAFLLISLNAGIALGDTGLLAKPTVSILEVTGKTV